MILVECPICDHDAPFDPESAELACDGCGVRLAVAPDDDLELAVAV